jgi:heptosyltransferase II
MRSGTELEPRAIKPWSALHRPHKVLAIRLHALGDTVITLPYLRSLRDHLPNVQLDFLTRKEVASIPQHVDLFDHVFLIGGRRNFTLQMLSTFLLLPRLMRQRYDVVIDLQRNKLSRLVRRVLRPAGYSEFDRLSLIAAGERTRLTIEAAGLGPVGLKAQLTLKDPALGRDILHRHGWKTDSALVVLNPAGFFVTRHWPIEHYVEFARLWLTHYNPHTQFLLLGTDQIAARVHVLHAALGEHVINLVGKTSAAEAFAVLQNVDLMLTEDSGLMHMAWVSGRPTVALFGSTRSDWARPLGEHTIYLDSADLPCGNCMQATCQFGDVHCLTRYTPSFVFAQARSLLERLRQRA